MYLIFFMSFKEFNSSCISLPIPIESFPIVSDRYRSKYVDYLENFLKGFICIHFLVTMDLRQQTDAEDE